MILNPLLMKDGKFETIVLESDCHHFENVLLKSSIGSFTLRNDLMESYSCLLRDFIPNTELSTTFRESKKSVFIADVFEFTS